MEVYNSADNVPSEFAGGPEAERMEVGSSRPTESEGANERSIEPTDDSDVQTQSRPSEPPSSDSSSTESGASANSVASEAEIHLRRLPSTSSLAPIKKWLQELCKVHSLLPQEVALFFDFDGTISNLEYDPARDFASEMVRGSSESRAFLEWMNQNQFYWFILSARAYTVQEIRDIVWTWETRMELPFPPWFLDLDVRDTRPASRMVKKCSLVQFDRRDSSSLPTNAFGNGPGDASAPGDYCVLQSYNFLGAIESGKKYAFNKDVALEYALDKYFVRRGLKVPKLIVFIDDDPTNFQLMLKHHEMRLEGSVDPEANEPRYYMGVYYEPPLKFIEPRHLELGQFLSSVQSGK